MAQLATLSLLLSLAVLILAPIVLGNHYEPLHCKRWKGSCERYNSHCSNDKAQHLLKSCCELLEADNQAEFSSGRYTLKTGSFSRSDAWCDMETDAGGWLVIMRREPTTSASDVFSERVFQEYEDGFGDLEGSFWYGLQAMERLTSSEDYEMRLDMYTEAYHNESAAHAHYNRFEVQGINYTLKIGNFSGSDSDLMNNLMQFNNRPFIARKTAVDISLSCVNTIQGAGWWYVQQHCVAGDMQTPGAVLTRAYNDLDWYDISMTPLARKFAKYEMKIRPTSCKVVT